MPNQTEVEALFKRLEKLGQDGVGNYGMPICAEAAAELRRLHDECNDLAHQLNESNERNGRLKAQRDALLEALREAQACFITQDITRQEYERLYPDAVEENK